MYHQSVASKGSVRFFIVRRCSTRFEWFNQCCLQRFCEGCCVPHAGAASAAAAAAAPICRCIICVKLSMRTNRAILILTTGPTRPRSGRGRNRQRTASAPRRQGPWRFRSVGGTSWWVALHKFCDFGTVRGLVFYIRCAIALRDSTDLVATGLVAWRPWDITATKKNDTTRFVDTNGFSSKRAAIHIAVPPNSRVPTKAASHGKHNCALPVAMGSLQRGTHRSGPVPAWLVPIPSPLPGRITIISDEILFSSHNMPKILTHFVSFHRFAWINCQP